MGLHRSKEPGKTSTMIPDWYQDTPDRKVTKLRFECRCWRKLNDDGWTWIAEASMSHVFGDEPILGLGEEMYLAIADLCNNLDAASEQSLKELDEELKHGGLDIEGETL